MRSVRLNSVQAGVTTLGPSPAVCVWVQGCGIGCRDCMSPNTWSGSGGASARVTDVAAWAVDTGLAHLTISGGEPTDQADALCELVDVLRAERPWTVTCYSGRTREQLERDIPSGSAALLERLDLLIDGPYATEQHAPLRWRGSRNQRLHALSERVRIPDDDMSAGLEMFTGDDGTFTLVGVPSAPGLVAALRSQMTIDDAPPSVESSVSFPFPTLENQ
jgi:anaerobic ribonucleoside-triphosphate reductase activating protein